MQEQRNWTDKERKKIMKLRADGQPWKVIAAAVHEPKVENVIAVYRRAIGAKYSSYLKKEQELKEFEPPRVVVLDVETLPMIKYAWSLWDQHGSPEEIIKPSCMLSWAGKTLNDPEIVSDIMTVEEVESRDTERMVHALWDYLHDADVVIGHNFSDFDRRVINSEFLKYRLPPIEYTVVDTLSVYKRNFKSDSNKMKYLNEEYELSRKVDNEGFPLWKKCDQGDPKALKLMLEYNEGDILSTEDLYYLLRPYVKNVNLALYVDDTTTRCRVCGSENLTVQDKQYSTPAGLWDSFRCEDCGALARGKDNRLSKSKRKSLLNATR